MLELLHIENIPVQNIPLPDEVDILDDINGNNNQNDNRKEPSRILNMKYLVEPFQIPLRMNNGRIRNEINQRRKSRNPACVQAGMCGSGTGKAYDYLPEAFW